MVKNIPLESLNLQFDEFSQAIEKSLPIMKKIFVNDLVIPEFESFCENVKVLYQNLKDNFDGEVSNKVL